MLAANWWVDNGGSTKFPFLYTEFFAKTEIVVS